MHGTCLTVGKAGIAIAVIGPALVGSFWLACQHHIEVYLLAFGIICIYACASIECQRRPGHRTG